MVKLSELIEGYSVLPPLDRDRYGPRQGLEGPFTLRSGKVVYYDTTEGRYYDPDTDIYLSDEEYRDHDQNSFNTPVAEEGDDSFAKANKKIHKVESEWHYPIMAKYGFEPLDTTGVGFVRSYLYAKGDHKIKVATGVNADYWTDQTVGGHGYWATLEPHLKKISGQNGINEMGSMGGMSAGSVASVATPLGGMQRRVPGTPKKKKKTAEAKNAGKAINFSGDDIKQLSLIPDLDKMKERAMTLISNPGKHPMNPEKVEWFRNAMDRLNTKEKVIKLMYDLFLSGEGMSVIGSVGSMKDNSYRNRFAEGIVDGPTEVCPGCGGEGNVAMQRCKTCGGSGMVVDLDEATPARKPKQYSCYLDNADYQKLRKASMRGDFSHKFSRAEDTGNVTFTTINPNLLVQQLETLIDVGGAAWSEILQVEQMAEGTGSDAVLTSGVHKVMVNGTPADLKIVHGKSGINAYLLMGGKLQRLSGALPTSTTQAEFEQRIKKVYNQTLLFAVSEGKDKPASVKFNPVAKNMNKFNKASVQTDRKKDSKRGITKHKGQGVGESRGSKK